VLKYMIPVAALIGVLIVAACSDDGPTQAENQAPRSSLHPSQLENGAEEEIFGAVFDGGNRTTRTDLVVRLVPLEGGAQITNANGSASAGSDWMPVVPSGSRPGKNTLPNIMWGWYDPEAGDGPCRPNAQFKAEVHDMNGNGTADGLEVGTPTEAHCAVAGTYRVELRQGSRTGSVFASYSIDKVRGTGESIGEKGIEDPDLSSGTNVNVIDNVVHFTIGSSGTPGSVSGTYAIDNAATSTASDTTGQVGDIFRFDAQHTSGWTSGQPPTLGKMQVEYDWGDGSESRFATADRVIRVKSYDDADNFAVSANVLHPDSTGITGQQRTVIVRQSDDADGIGHTLPASIEVGEWVATSVTMKNTGLNTWTTSDYKLRQSPLSIWSPIEVSLSNPVASLETRTINFNMTTFEPEFVGTSQNNFWQMRHGTTFFGDVVGRLTAVKSGSGTLASLWNRVLARLGPGAAWARGLVASPGLVQDDTVQVLRKVDYPLDVEALASEGRVVLRYTASLSERWPVDFAFHLQFDPRVFRLGDLVRGAKAEGYAVETEIRGWDVTVRATRAPGAALEPGEGTILEIPLVLQPNAEAPETLPLVELITTR